MQGRMRALVSIGLLVTLLSSCAELGTKTTIGGLGGAAAGGLIGAAAGGGSAGIAAGVILGGLLGGAVGRYLDQRDRQLQQQAASRALETAPSGTTTTWQNPDSGNQGTVTPRRTYQAPSGQYCREFEQTITIGGQKQRSYGTACRQPDGAWQIVS